MKLHDFSGLDGSSPSGALVQDRNGNLYGMTSYGGANGLGVIFKVGSDGTGFRKLLDFSMESGNLPHGALVIREDIFTSDAVAQSLSTELTSPGIHPNPSTDHFNIHINSTTNERMILSVTDQYGQLITTYDIIANTPMQFGAELERGLYIMKVTRGKEILMQRVVKK